MRELKVVESADGTHTVRSFWLGGQLMSELHDDSTLFDFVYGPGGVPLELVVSDVAVGPNPEDAHVLSSTSYYFEIDHQGSVIGLLDESLSRVARYEYDPWGRPLSVIGGELAERQPLRYRSHYHDTETGSYYMPARY